MLYGKSREFSRSLFERAKKVMPGGISHNLRFFPPFPFYAERADGPFLWDIDGNRYIDFWMGHYAHILGHRHKVVREAVAKFILENGFHFGVPCREEVELAELVVELVPSAEMVRFCSSGTEAAMYAVRLARAYTGRNGVIKISGGWHGASTDLSFGISPPFEVPETQGLPKGLKDQIKLVRFNDIKSLDEAFSELEGDVACVIVEPVLGAGGFIPADKDFLQALRRKTAESGAVLIFDEVITGFRVGLGGFQKLCGVFPDLTVLGKILGGGFPIGAVAGKKEILLLSSWEREKPKRVLIGGGTFSCNPVSMVAGLSVLRFLAENEDKVYGRLSYLGNYLREKAKKLEPEVKVTGIGSLFMLHFMRTDGNLKCAEDVVEKTYWEIKDTVFRAFMAERGFFLVHGAGAISLAHEEEHIDLMLEAVKEFLELWKRESL